MKEKNCQETPLISVIVPVYNVEAFLPVCIESIINQTYKNLEIVLVDDGSSDACPEICNNYEKKDKRIKVIHKENGGLSDARNVGLNEAKGSYITFVDSDDYLGKNFVEITVNRCLKNDADICICDYISVEEKQNAYVHRKQTLEKVYSNRECLINTYSPTIHGMEFVAWGKLYRIDLFKKNNIVFPKGKIHEDTFTTYKVIYNARKIVMVDYVGYYYRQRSGSIMNKKFNKKRLVMSDATKEACEFFLLNKEEELFDYAVNYHIKTSLNLYSSIIEAMDCDEILKHRYKKKMQNEFRYYLKQSNLSIVKKMIYKFVACFPIKGLVEKLK